MNEQRVVLRQQRDLGQIFEGTINLCIQNFGPLFAIAAVVIPIGIASAAFQEGIDDLWVEAAVLSGLGLLQGIASLLAAAAVIAALAEIDAGRPAEFSRAYDAAFAKIWTLAGAVLRVAAVIFPALALLLTFSILASYADPDSNDAALLFILPLVMIVTLPWIVYFAVRWLFVEQAVILDGTSAKAALSYSADAMTGSWWRTFGIAALTGIVAGVPATIVSALFALAPPLVSGTVNALVNAALLPFTITAMTLLYMDLKTRKETAVAEGP